MKKTMNVSYDYVTITCIQCGSSFETRSTLKGPAVKVDSCSCCHPFYNRANTSQHVDRRTEKFNKKFNF